MGISVLDPAEGALRDPRKFFLTNNLRFVKKVWSSSKLSALEKNMQIPKTLHFVCISLILCAFCGVFKNYRVSVFWIQQEELCGIQENFS